MSENSELYRTAIGRPLVDIEENEQGEVALVFGKREEDGSVRVHHVPLPDGRVSSRLKRRHRT